jgi:hypothetical protein
MRMTEKQIEMYDYLMENSVGFDDLNKKCQLYIINQILSGNTDKLLKLSEDEE